jgi:uncharacterized protein YigE (DUF2233 family)
LGLYIYERVVKKPLNLSSGKGNFHELTNGILAFEEKKVDIIESRKYNPKDSWKWAIQTGPMLVYSGVINSELRPESKNFNIRGGVGIRNDSTGYSLIFARSNTPINFHHLANLFLREFHCEKALCLESGSFSNIRLPGFIQSRRKVNASCLYIGIEL